MSFISLKILASNFPKIPSVLVFFLLGPQKKYADLVTVPQNSYNPSVTFSLGGSLKAFSSGSPFLCPAVSTLL